MRGANRHLRDFRQQKVDPTTDRKSLNVAILCALIHALWTTSALAPIQLVLCEGRLLLGPRDGHMNLVRHFHRDRGHTVCVTVFDAWLPVVNKLQGGRRWVLPVLVFRKRKEMRRSVRDLCVFRNVVC